MLGTQILLASFSLLAGIFVAYFTFWPLLFGIGASIAAYNFWFLAKFVQNNLSDSFSPILLLRLVGGFNLRLILTGVVLFALIVWLKVPLAPLLAGLTSLVACIVIWGFSRLTRKPI